MKHQLVISRFLACSVAIFFSCFQVSCLSGQQTDDSKDAIETPASRNAKVKEAESIIAELKQAKSRGFDTKPWVEPLKKLVELGPSAVDPICKALRATDVDFEMRLYGFALRAIGDPRAVQALIESLPKTLLPPGSDMGYTVDDKELHEFMRKNDLDERDLGPGKSFGFGRPIREINGAIKKLTKHEIGGDEISSIFLDGGPLQIYYRRKLYYDHTVRWHQWWTKNYESRGVEMDYVDIELAPFEFKKPKILNEFTETGARATGRLGGRAMEPYVSAKYICFYDLDTGRTGKLPKQFDANSPIEEVSKWARSEGFDLMGVPMTKGKKLPCVLKPLEMKAWQNPAARFKTIDSEIGDKEIQMGTLATKYLAYFDKDSGKYDPDREVTFLFQTEEGTCGAMNVICQVTELLTKDDYGKTSREIPKNRGIVLGVKFELKLFVSQ